MSAVVLDRRRIYIFYLKMDKDGIKMDRYCVTGAFEFAYSRVAMVTRSKYPGYHDHIPLILKGSRNMFLSGGMTGRLNFARIIVKFN